VNVLSYVDKIDKNWLPRQRSLKDGKPNCRLIINGHSSTNPETLAKTGPVAFEIIGRNQQLGGLSNQNTSI